MARLDRHMHLPARPVAVDSVTCDQVLDEGEPFNCGVPHDACVIRANDSFQFLLAARDTVEGLCTAAARSTPGHAVLFQHHYAVTPLREMQGSRAAGKATTDDANVTFHRAHETGACGGRVRGSGIVRVDVRSSLHDSRAV